MVPLKHLGGGFAREIPDEGIFHLRRPSSGVAKQRMGRGPFFFGRALRCAGNRTVLRDTLETLLRPVVESLGYELWELEFSGGKGNGLLRLYLDAEQGITVEDCERVSRTVSEVLDAADPIPGNYTLEVSSPGLDRPLRTGAHFARFVGAEVFVEMVHAVGQRRRFAGRLVATGEGAIEVDVEGERHTLPLVSIRKAHLVPEA